MNAMPLFSDASHVRNNVLFLIPGSIERHHNDRFEATIRQMAEVLAHENYVYVAHAGVRDWQDDPHGVRYLPLAQDRIPCFGRLATAYVAGDDALAVAVATEHPEASVFVMRPAGEEGEAHVERKAAAWSSEPLPDATFIHLPTVLAGMGRATMTH